MFSYLIYISEAAKLMPEEELTGLLNNSRMWNEANGVTGMMLYVQGKFLTRNGGRFIQVLEGSPSDVKLIFEKIRLDKKHHNIIILNEGTTKKRNFTKWSMGFKVISLDDVKKVPGFFDLDGRSLDTTSAKRFNMPLTFLRSFYQMNVAHDI